MYRLLAVLALVAATQATDYTCSNGVSPHSCQNFKVSNLISQQVNNELKAAYEYRAMGSYFARDDVAWPGLSKMFYVMAAEEDQHAQSLMDYMAMRGGRVELSPVTPPAANMFDTWGPVEAVAHALAAEKSMNSDLLDLHAAAEGDPHFQNHLEEELLKEQVNAIRVLSFYRTQTERLKFDSHALTAWDSELKGDPHHA